MNTMIICASGPSLTLDDCVTAMQSRATVVAVNSSWERVPACQFIYAADLRWWCNNIAAVPSGPEKWTCDRRASETWGLNLFQPPYRSSFNSGMRAIQFAASRGAQNIILLGYDCSVRQGTHWHGDHLKSGNPGELSVRVWQREFQQLSEYLTNVNIFNCTRETELTCFPRFSLSQALLACGLPG